MGDGGPETPPTARWLAFAAACLLIAAMVSAGVIGFGDGTSSDAVVAAAGRTTATEPVPSTVTLPPPSTIEPASPTSTIRTTTTLPRAAVEVLRAIGTTAPPTTAPTPTAPPTTATTVRPPTTTTTAAPRMATVTVINAHPQPVVVTVNGRTFELAPDDDEGPVQVTLPATGDDVIQVRVTTDAACAGELAADFFQPFRTYDVTIAAGPTACTNFPAPMIQVTAR